MIKDVSSEGMGQVFAEGLRFAVGLLLSSRATSLQCCTAHAAELGAPPVPWQRARGAAVLLPHPRGCRHGVQPCGVRVCGEQGPSLRVVALERHRNG